MTSEEKWHPWKAWFPVWSQEDGKMIWAWPFYRKAVEWQLTAAYETIRSWEMTSFDEHMICVDKLYHYRLAK